MENIERTEVEKVEVERTEIDRTEVNTIDIPQSEAEKKPNLLKRGGAWLKRNGPTILKGAGLVLAGIAVGAFVGLCACKRNDNDMVYEPAEDDGDDYDYDNDDVSYDETETEDSSDDFDYESTEEES